MAQAVTHILVPILLISIFRDFYLKKRDKSSFPLHYVLIAGLGGVLPDIDIIFFWLFGNFDVSLFTTFHKTITHSIIFPAFFFLIFLIFKNTNAKAKVCNLGRHKLKLSLIALMLAFGILTYIFLDYLLWFRVEAFYPFSDINFGYNILQFIPESLQEAAIATLDGVLLVIWIIYLEIKHKISDFI